MLTVNFTVEKLIGKRTEPREAARVPGWETETQKRNQFFRSIGARAAEDGATRRGVRTRGSPRSWSVPWIKGRQGRPVGAREAEDGPAGGCGHAGVQGVGA